MATIAVLASAGCANTLSNLDSTRTRVAATRYEISVKSVLGVLSSPQAVERAWDAEATKACGGKPWDAVSRNFVDALQTGMKGIIECR